MKDFYKKNKRNIYILIRLTSTLTLLYLILDSLINRRIPSQDIIAVFFVLFAISINKGKRFILDWMPIFIFFYLYEVARGHAYIVQDFFNISVHKTTLLEWEKVLFGDNIPTLRFQKLIKDQPTILDYIALVTYTSFFWGAMLTGFIVWIKSKHFFRIFRNAYVFLSYTALATVVFFPAYPPWLAAKEGFLPVLQTNTYGRIKAGEITLGLFHTAGYNPVAPFPSLHTGWSVLCAVMLDLNFKKRIGIFSKLFYLYPLTMYFVIIYTSDHYVVDIIAGTLYALAAVYFGLNSDKILAKMKESIKFKYKNENSSQNFELNIKEQKTRI